MVKKYKIAGVITGDLVNSSGLTRETKNLLITQLDRFARNNPGVLLPLEFYRGDSFQLMVCPELTARTAVFIEAMIIATAQTRARLSIGIGSVSKITPGKVLMSEGEAFQLSGKQIEGMKEEGRILKITVSKKTFQPLLAASFHLLESLIRGWKPGQAAVISQIPFTRTQKEIAERLNISGAAVSKALKAGKWPVVEDFLSGFENTIKVICK